MRRYGAEPVDTACGRALELDVVSVTKVASMLERATENATPLMPAHTSAATARFARDAGEFTTSRGPKTDKRTLAGGGAELTLIPGGGPVTEQGRTR